MSACEKEQSLSVHRSVEVNLLLVAATISHCCTFWHLPFPLSLQLLASI